MILLFADLGSSLDKFYKKFFEISINRNKAGSLNDQTGGYYTFGGYVVRNRAMNAQIASIQMPSIRTDCGGIDAYLGGFSYINSEQLVSALKSIGSSALSYAFMLALETVSPQVTNVIKQLQSWSQAVNRTNINSCETAATLTSAVFPKHEMASSHACRITGSSFGRFSDYVRAKHGCNDAGERQRTLDDADQRLPHILKDRFNVAWQVIQKNNLWANDKNFAEVMMSITGTIISDGQSHYKIFVSKIFDDDFMNCFLEGGHLKVYKCSDDKCLVLKEGSYYLEKKQAYYGRVEGILKSIEHKIYSEELLDETEQNLINETRLPIYKIINVMSAYHQGRSPIDLISYVELIAQDLVLAYIKNVIEMARNAANQLIALQMNAKPIEDYIKNLNAIERRIRMKEKEIKDKIDQVFMLIHKTQLLEQEMYSKMRGVVKE